jgi:hypothetical protein
MTLSRAVSDVVAEHTLFEIEAIDRILLNLYVPTLQHPRALVGYVHAQLGLPLASTAPLAAVSARFEKAVGAFAAAQGIPVVHLIKGLRKDDVAHEYLKRFLASGQREGVLFIGRAQEKAPGKPPTTCLPQRPRLHPPHPAQPPLPRHRHRPGPGHVPGPGP